ncbi:hypothetical protein [Halobaculum limi]|uniref:hypothetical protein n=1 Tax=Halobaculum limi TaxID=3031916 RepID=UPI002406E780|nr:hypothetical protein [Halobaculum sp. YSMS11]
MNLRGDDSHGDRGEFGDGDDRGDRDRRDGRERRRRENRLAAGLFLAVAALAFLPPLGPGEGFLPALDMVFAPDASHLQFALDAKGPLYYGRLPFVALVDAVSAVVPAWVVQRVILVGIVAGAGYVGYAAAGALLGKTSDGTAPFVARLFAGLLFAVNPFLYVRLLAGQWFFALGYAVLPLAVVAFHAYVAGEESRPTRALAWVTLVAVFDPHAAVLAAVGGAVLFVVEVAAAGVDTDAARETVARAVRFCALAVGVNAYWLLPAVAAVLGGDSHLSTVDGADLAAFSPRGSVLGNVPLSVAMLYGFWREGYVYPFDVAPLWLVVCGFVFLLTLAVYGWLITDSPAATGFALVGLVAAVLGLGVAVPAVAPVYRAFATTPVGAGMREAGKFVGLLAVAYALLGALGVRQIRADLTRLAERRSLTADRRRLLAGLLLVCVVALPVTYTAPMVAGFGGQFEATDYPDDWHAVEEQLADDDAEFRTLYLPWHQYIRYEWAGGTVAAPAPLFFGPDTVASRDPDLGIGSQATDPTHRRIGALLADDPGDGFGAAVAPLGVKYVVVSQTADYERYVTLDADPALETVYRGDRLVLYENRAFDGGDPASWPADGPAVPWSALAFGSVVSLATVGGSLRKLVGRRTRPRD